MKRSWILFSIKTRLYGESGLYNPLYQSNLSVELVTIQGGTATVHLSGSFQLAGELDIPRVEAQITQTTLAFATVRHVLIFVNGKSLATTLSLK